MTEHHPAGRPCRPLRGLQGSSLALLLALLLTLAVAGCASPSPTTTPPPGGEKVPANAGSAPTALPVSGELSSSCTRPSPDGSVARLTSVELISQGDQLVIAFTMAQRLPTDLSVNITANPGKTVPKNEQPGLSVTANVHAGTPVTVGIETPTGSALARNPEKYVHVVDNQIHIGLPSDLLVAVGPQWHWRATAVSGNAHGQCPGNAGTGAADSAVVVT